MKRLTKAGVLAVGVALASQAAQAQFTANDLYLGFTQSSASSDYLIDLGQPGVVGVGGSSVVNLSSDFSMSLFTSIFTGGATGVSMGVVGGQSHFPSSYDLFATAPIGSNLSGVNHSQSTIASAEADLTVLPFPTAGSGVADSTKSWNANVSPTFTASTFYGASGIEPDSAIDNTGIINEGLWEATPTSAYSYLGYFTLDTTGGNPSLTFTPSAVPEPNTYALGGFALLLCLLLRRFNYKKV
jgi:hypothetical protein